MYLEASESATQQSSPCCAIPQYVSTSGGRCCRALRSANAGLVGSGRRSIAFREISTAEPGGARAAAVFSGRAAPPSPRVRRPRRSMGGPRSAQDDGKRSQRTGLGAAAPPACPQTGSWSTGPPPLLFCHHCVRPIIALRFLRLVSPGRSN